MTRKLTAHSMNSKVHSSYLIRSICFVKNKLPINSMLNLMHKDILNKIKEFLNIRYIWTRLLGHTFSFQKKIFPQIGIPGQTEDLHPSGEIQTRVSPTIKKCIYTHNIRNSSYDNQFRFVTWFFFFFPFGFHLYLDCLKKGSNLLIQMKFNIISLT